MEHHPERYEAHLAGFRRTAEVRGRDEYEAMYQRSLDEPERFWAEQARRYLTWDRPWDFVLRADFEEARFEWFGGGVLNASANCLDRHLPALADKTAYYWEGDEPGRSDRVTYGQLHRRVNKLAALLKSRGLGRGDRVVIYMPMIVELPTALLACARIGAIHCVVFGGLGAAALADRIRDCGARAVITADAASRGGRPIPLKNIVDQALEDCEGVETVIVHDHRGSNPALKTGRDLWWHQAAAEPGLPDFVPPEPMDAEDPLFILHTSGSTGKPKGLVHTHGGYLVHTAMSARLVFDLQPEDVFWCTGNLDWITGHSYGVYGPLLNGLTMVLYEGLPDFPGPDRFWRIAEHYRVSSLYTMPTTIRGWAREGPEPLEGRDLSSIRMLGTVGEPINAEAWRWYYHHVGRERCPIMDTWWQTETGAHMITPLPAVGALKPGSCGLPFFGIDPVIVDPETQTEIPYPHIEGALFIRRPWPGMARTVYNDHAQYRAAYFSALRGWFFSGDGARKDEDGLYYITGRIDDLITVNNHRLGTAEIESALDLHPRVAEAAVVGLAHPTRGQRIVAFVTLNRDASGSEALKEELNRLVQSEIGPIAALDTVYWADSLPKTMSGKIMHRLLKKIASGQGRHLGDTSTLADPEAVRNLVKACSES